MTKNLKLLNNCLFIKNKIKEFDKCKNSSKSNGKVVEVF